MDEISLIDNFMKLPFIVVKNGLVIKANEKFLEMTEFNSDELINFKLVDIFRKLRLTPSMEFDKNNEETQYHLFNKSLEAKVGIFQVISADEEKIYVFNKKHEHNFDVKSTFADLLFSDNFYGIAIFSMPDIILINANEKYLSALDKPYNNKKECIGNHISKFISGFTGSTFETIWNTVLITGKSYNINEYKYENLNRETTYWKISLIPICEDSKIKYCIELSIEITEEVLARKKVEEQGRLIEEQKKHLEKTLEMKDEFLFFMSHEFKTPLNVISSAVQAMKSICGSELPEKAQKYIEMIRLNNLRQIRLVNNLLDITRADDGRIKINKKNVDIVFLTKVITESVHTYAFERGIKVSFKSPLEKKIVGIDDEKYERVILNLLSNAIKFSSVGKSVTVKLLSKKDKIYIEVKDYGIGIPDDKLDLIFDKFGQVDSSLSRRAEGTGIGLSLVKKFVEALGGNISVKSKLGKGSIFMIVFPNETITEENVDNKVECCLNNRLIESAKVELSDIYL